ncbi:MAG: HAMP domain-containing sensor histidine kinase [Succinivibrio sp.]|nr:HAMP domain-containing sensor histidine kinase [Succinivibrio sp.]
MEGRKGSLIRSLRFRLCLLLSVLGVIVGGFICSTAYWRSLSESETFVDEELSQIASVIVEYNLTPPRFWRGPQMKDEKMMPPPRLPRRGMRDSHWFGPTPSLADLFIKHQEIIIAPLFVAPGDPVYLPLEVEDGFYTLLIENKRVRAYIATTAGGVRFVVARPVEILESLSKRVFVISLAEFLLLLLIFVPALVCIVNFTLRGVRRMAGAVNRRRENDLRPLDIARVPSEIDPLIEALNRLFNRTRESMQNERRFIADAAHELRTPLTAISLKAQNFDEEGLSQAQLEKLHGLRSAIRQQQSLTTDLLTLARSQCAPESKAEEVVVHELFAELCEELGPLADERDIDFGIDSEEIRNLSVPRAPLRAALLNLCSNAIKYTPKGGKVDLNSQLRHGVAVVSVTDNGLGIPQKELKAVFEPFYRVGGDTSRVQGTGLGLSIVKSSCAQIGARCELENVKPHGLRASLIFDGAKPGAA